jgi:hypothetical protein
MGPSLPQLCRGAALLAVAALVVTVTGACETALSPSRSPSVGLASTATNPTPLGTAVMFTVTASSPGNPANIFIKSIHLDFGDGQSADLGATPGSVPHMYSVAGTFTASATATDTSGNKGKALLTIVVNGLAPTPSVGLTSTATNPTPLGTVVTFTVTASIPGSLENDSIQSIHLDFGDGLSADLGATPGDVPHMYSTAGTFTASATATARSGSQGKASLTIVVSGTSPMPSVGLTSTATNPTLVGTAITFTVTTSIPRSPANDFIQSIHLDFGDGQSVDLGATPPITGVPHTYAVAGTFTASAMATATSGNQGKASLTIVVKEPSPSVGLTSTATNPTPVGTVITFTVTASIPGNPANDFIRSIHLDFGDGQSVNLGATPPSGGVPHAYAAAGTFTANATATDTNGNDAKASLTIIVR